MPNVYKPNLIQIRPIYDVNPDTSRFPENVLWFQSVTSGTPNIGNLQSIQSVFDADWPNVWKLVGATSKHYRGSVVTDWSSNSGLQSSSVGTLTPVAGTGSGTVLPSNVAVLLSLAVQIRYRGGHGRVYLPWITNTILNASDSNTIQGSTATAVTNAAGTFLGQMAASGVLGGQIWSIYRHRTNSSLASIQGVVLTTCSATLASQRRRLRKAAHH